MVHNILVGFMSMTIVADFREKPSGVISLLQGRGMDVAVKKLSWGDYIVNNRVTIERKTGTDFLISLIDGRLFKQASNLKRFCMHPVFLIEGNPYKTDMDVNCNAIRGALISLQTAWYLPVVYSRCKEETRDILMQIAVQGAEEVERDVLRHGYRPKPLRSRQLYILQGLPHVGPVLARRLLERFGSVDKVMGASEEEFLCVTGIGKALAGRIHEVLTVDTSGTGQR